MKTAGEIREAIIETVRRNGGHLASSLGAVELSMALVQAFDPLRDRIVWDVGHQAYAWKILTGRSESFGSIRSFGGLSPFPDPAESAADAAIAGHAGAAFSVALGLAAARDKRGGNEHIVVVVGDSSMANGHSFEAMNNCAIETNRIIVVLNDNGMSISRPEGSFSTLLARLTSSVRYNRAKNAVKMAARKMRLSFLYSPVHKIKSALKTLLLGNIWFEQFGLHYMGPVDGHDLSALSSALSAAKGETRPVLLHVVTKKGKGHKPAEENPVRFHGVSPEQSGGAKRTWSNAFGDALSELARSDERVVALTAGMADGTGLSRFAGEFRGRFRDVGIAEGHLVSYASGLAAGGLRPFVAVYSTFLQRAVDQVMHDVCIRNLPVVICVDRAGVVGQDGVTHQGLYDYAMLKSLPNLVIVQPKDEEDLKALLKEALERNGPTVIRYPRGEVPSKVEAAPSKEGGACCAIWATGDSVAKANEIAAAVGGCEVVYARSLKPYDRETLLSQRRAGMKIISIENAAVSGGFGETIGADLRFGWPDEFIPHGSCAELERKYALDVETMISTTREFLSKDEIGKKEG